MKAASANYRTSRHWVLSPRSCARLVENDGEISRRAWESALLTAVRDEVRAGNLYVHHSQRFGRFDDFFITDSEWEKQRRALFRTRRTASESGGRSRLSRATAGCRL